VREQSGPCLCGDPECRRCFPGDTPGNLPTPRWTEGARVFGCHKHDPLGSHPMTEDETCPHCAADSEILEEKIEAVVRSVVSVVESRAAGPRLDEFRIALLELVR
jgi:hypothetical protein